MLLLMSAWQQRFGSMQPRSPQRTSPGVAHTDIVGFSVGRMRMRMGRRWVLGGGGEGCRLP